MSCEGLGPVVDRLKPLSQRIAALAVDMMAHRENRNAGMGKFIAAPGRAMMIVGGRREIWAKLYAAIVELQPGWHSDDLAKVKNQGGLLRHAIRRAAGGQGAAQGYKRLAGTGDCRGVSDEFPLDFSAARRQSFRQQEGTSVRSWPRGGY